MRKGTGIVLSYGLLSNKLSLPGSSPEILNSLSTYSLLQIRGSETAFSLVTSVP